MHAVYRANVCKLSCRQNHGVGTADGQILGQKEGTCIGCPLVLANAIGLRNRQKNVENGSGIGYPLPFSEVN